MAPATLRGVGDRVPSAVPIALQPDQVAGGGPKVVAGQAVDGDECSGGAGERPHQSEKPDQTQDPEAADCRDQGEQVDRQAGS